jgi:hypothetical protein
MLRLEVFLKSLAKAKKFSRSQNRHDIVLVWGRHRGTRPAKLKLPTDQES